jgi:4-hydroxy-tetrahydrodipicolinate synthase
VAVQLSAQAAAAGADALMVQPPYVYKPDPAGILEHYRAVSQAVSVPIIVQDEPVITGLTLAPALLAQLCADLSNVRYVKVEHVPTAMKMTRVLEAARAAGAEPPGLLGGMGALYFLDELRRGAVGIMTGFAYPDLIVAIYRAWTAGDAERAAELFYRYLPLIVYEGQLGVAGVAIRKLILQLRGLIATSYVRAPRGPAVDSQTWDELRALIAQLELPL